MIGATQRLPAPPVVAGDRLSTRKPWLDWQRGLAVLFMIEVHVLDAWRAPGLGGHLAGALRFVGGLAAPGFLYLAGLSLVLADRAGAARGVPPPERRARLLRRAAALFGVAVGLRAAEVVTAALVQEAIPWSELVRVDVLHVIALALAAAAWLGVGRGRAGPLLAGAAAVAVVAAAPALDRAVAGLGLPGALDPGGDGLGARAWALATAALAGRPPRATFCLVNWSGFLLAGVALGPLAARPGTRPGAWLGVGAALVGVGVASARIPALGADFWSTSPAWWATRLGLCATLTGLVQLWPAALARPLGPLAKLGRRSLLAYIVSLELTYGGVARPLRGRLGMAGILAGVAGMTVVTWAVVAAWDAWRARGARSTA